MTIPQLLDIPTEELAALTDSQLEQLLGPLVPQSRAPDKERFQQRHAMSVQQMAEMALRSAGIDIPKQQLPTIGGNNQSGKPTQLRKLPPTK